MLTLEWPIEILRRAEEHVLIKHGADREDAIALFQLVCGELSPDRRTLQFSVASEDLRAEYQFALGTPDAFAITQTGGDTLSIAMGRAERPLDQLLSDWPPLVRFVDLSELDGKPSHPASGGSGARLASRGGSRFGSGRMSTSRRSPFGRAGEERPDSVQASVAARYIEGGFDVVFDDDAPGEAADLVCLKSEEDHLRVALVHCKFAPTIGGARVDDVVEVCSQAVRSGRWMWSFRGLCRHLLTREKRLDSGGRGTRFLRGDAKKLNALVRESRFKEVRGEIAIAQPGVSQANHSSSQRAVLASAHCFLNDTVGVPLDVICSA